MKLLWLICIVYSFSSLWGAAVNSPPEPSDLEKSIQKATSHLIATQNKNGSWGSATLTKDINIYAPVPGAHHAMRSASTSLALIGLLESGIRDLPTQSAIKRGEAWLLAELPKLKRADTITTYNVWGHAYALRALTRLSLENDRSPEQQIKLKNLAKQQAEQLFKQQEINGGWGYLDFDGVSYRSSGSPTSFTTATAVLALLEANSHFSLSYTEKDFKPAIKQILKQKNPDFSYLYSEDHTPKPRYAINRPAGSLARSQACNLALYKAHDPTVNSVILNQWLDRLWKRIGWLDLARKKTMPHESFFANSGYFFFYGIFYSSECILQLPTHQQAQHARELSKILLKTQESDGSWWDYPLYAYHQPYGTGYGLTAMARCANILKNVPQPKTVD